MLQYVGDAKHIGMEELWNDFIAVYGERDAIYISLGGDRRRIGEHPLVTTLAGKRVRVTIEEITDGERA